jgi:hypothetical protein
VKQRRGKAVVQTAPAPQDEAALVATTLRLEPGVRRGLELLQGALGVTLNKLMNEGLAIYVAQRTAALERDMQASLERIKQYRRTDPTFSKAFAAIADEEAMHAHDDPVQGVPALDTVREPAGPTVVAVRRLMPSCDQSYKFPVRPELVEALRQAQGERDGSKRSIANSSDAHAQVSVSSTHPSRR